MYDQASKEVLKNLNKLNSRKQIVELRKIIDRVVKENASILSRRFKVHCNPTKAKYSGAFNRVAIPDIHGTFVDQRAWNCLLGDLEVIQPKQIVFLGDVLEVGGFHAEHQTMCYVAEGEYSYVDDCDAANQCLDQVQKICPKAEIHFLEGNHERRVERWCMTQKIRNRKDVENLRQLYCAENRLRLAERGFHYYKQGKFYHGCSIPATIRLGKCYFTHGSFSSAKKHVEMFSGNVVFGDIHREDSFTSRTVKDGRIGAWCPGCLCKLQRLWNHTTPTKWAHGYHLQRVQKDQSFLPLNVPIINGKSYLDTGIFT